MSPTKRMETLDELAGWVLSVDRRALVMKSIDGNGAFGASEIAERTGRSVQNISRAIHELSEEGLAACLDPAKRTWKRFVLTDKGKTVFSALRDDPPSGMRENGRARGRNAHGTRSASTKGSNARPNWTR